MSIGFGPAPGAPWREQNEVSGVYRPENDRRADIAFAFPVTSAELGKVESAIQSRLSTHSPPRYDVIDHNCCHEALAVIRPVPKLQFTPGAAPTLAICGHIVNSDDSPDNITPETLKTELQDVARLRTGVKVIEKP